MVDIKTEIPKESSGRLIDALTDVIRPFTEKRGLKGDQIRLQREEVLFEIARRAKMRAALDGTDVQPIPNKILIPLLEKASCEELDSPLLDWWANLLVSQASPGAKSRPYFADLISRLGPIEARLLERLWKAYPPRHGAEGPTWHSALAARGLFEIAVGSALANAREGPQGDWERRYEDHLIANVQQTTKSWEETGTIISFVRLKLASGETGWRTDLSKDEWISVDVCKALQVLEEFTHNHEADAIDLSNKVHSLGWIDFTALGFEFMAATHRPATEPPQEP